MSFYLGVCYRTRSKPFKLEEIYIRYLEEIICYEDNKALNEALNRLPEEVVDAVFKSRLEGGSGQPGLMEGVSTQGRGPGLDYL